MYSLTFTENQRILHRLLLQAKFMSEESWWRWQSASNERMIPFMRML